MIGELSSLGVVCQENFIVYMGEGIGSIKLSWHNRASNLDFNNVKLQMMLKKIKNNVIGEFWRETFYLRSFALMKIPMIAFLAPSVVELSSTKTVIKIPYTLRSRNHLNSMYFGALAVGADLTAGFFAMKKIQESGKKISLSFKDMKADFHKRAYSDVHFVCDEGEEIAQFVGGVANSTSRMNYCVKVTAFAPKESSLDAIASFELTLSLKRKL